MRWSFGAPPASSQSVSKTSSSSAESFRRLDAHAHLLDVLQRAPVEVLAAQVALLAVDDEVLGVEDAAEELAADQLAHLQALDGGEGVGGLGVLEREGVVDQEPHPHAARAGGLEGLDDRGQAAGRLVGGVELRDVHRARGRVDHLHPHLVGVGHVGVVERGLDGRGLDEDELGVGLEGVRGGGPLGRAGAGGERERKGEEEGEAGSRSWALHRGLRLGRGRGADKNGSVHRPGPT
ncbi:MAG: hypothetical protein QM765_47830 [Myxococcales bacterium]